VELRSSVSLQKATSRPQMAPSVQRKSPGCLIVTRPFAFSQALSAATIRQFVPLMPLESSAAKTRAELDSIFAMVIRTYFSGLFPPKDLIVTALILLHLKTQHLALHPHLRISPHRHSLRQHQAATLPLAQLTHLAQGRILLARV